MAPRRGAMNVILCRVGAVVKVRMYIRLGAGLFGVGARDWRYNPLVLA
jgi:hypothetical protein